MKAYGIEGLAGVVESKLLEAHSPGPTPSVARHNGHANRHQKRTLSTADTTPQAQISAT